MRAHSAPAVTPDAASVAMMIEKGADVHAMDLNGWTPLHAAAYHGQDEIAKILLTSGADVNARNKLQETPLHLAAKWPQDKIVEVLLSVRGCGVLFAAVHRVGGGGAAVQRQRSIQEQQAAWPPPSHSYEGGLRVPWDAMRCVCSMALRSMRATSVGAQLCTWLPSSAATLSWSACWLLVSRATWDGGAGHGVDLPTASAAMVVWAVNKPPRAWQAHRRAAGRGGRLCSGQLKRCRLGSCVHAHRLRTQGFERTGASKHAVSSCVPGLAWWHSHAQVMHAPVAAWQVRRWMRWTTTTAPRCTWRCAKTTQWTLR